MLNIPRIVYTVGCVKSQPYMKDASNDYLYNCNLILQKLVDFNEQRIIIEYLLHDKMSNYAPTFIQCFVELRVFGTKFGH